MFDGENYERNDPDDEAEIVAWITEMMNVIEGMDDEAGQATILGECIISVWVFRIQHGRPLNLGPLHARYHELRRRFESKFGAL